MQCALVCGRLAEFVLAQLSGAVNFHENIRLRLSAPPRVGVVGPAKPTPKIRIRRELTRSVDESRRVCCPFSVSCLSGRELLALQRWDGKNEAAEISIFEGLRN
jgi:hypothetical protein